MINIRHLSLVYKQICYNNYLIKITIYKLKKVNIIFKMNK